MTMTAEQILEMINTKQDLNHEGYHGFAGDTPQPEKCKACRIEAAIIEWRHEKITRELQIQND